jgi:hypothetical protein
MATSCSNLVRLRPEGAATNPAGSSPGDEERRLAARSASHGAGFGRAQAGFDLIRAATSGGEDAKPVSPTTPQAADSPSDDRVSPSLLVAVVFADHANAR